jgi:hypothetical protein
VTGVGHDLLSSVTELTQRLRREQAALTRAMARAREISDGTDESGTITILLDDDGIARDVRVAADWRRRLDLPGVAPAVVAADAAAARRRATATAEALASESTVAGGPAPDAPPGWLVPVPPSGPDADLARPRRSLAEISAAVLAAVDDLERATEPAPPVHGAGAEGAVRVTLAQGRITECVINEAWLAGQDEATLAHALREAVSAAAAAGVAARRPLIEYQQRLDAIVADARANLHRLAGGVRP